jgi:hypothetical protein
MGDVVDFLQAKKRIWQQRDGVSDIEPWPALARALLDLANSRMAMVMRSTSGTAPSDIE